MSRNTNLILVLFCLVFFAAPLSAQVRTGTLRGFVTDVKGEMLPGVTIEITSDSLMSPRASVSDARGSYRFLYLPPGTYTVCAKLQGFETCEQSAAQRRVGFVHSHCLACSTSSSVSGRGMSTSGVS